MKRLSQSTNVSAGAPSARITSWASSSIWKYSTRSTLSTWAIVAALTRCCAWTSTSSKWSERPGHDPDRQHRAVAGDKSSVIGAMPDPFDRPRRAAEGDHLVADRQILDRYLA